MTSPAFVTRGLVEGFYGPPWTHEERLDMIAFLGRHGFNTFVYAPKDDHLVRRDWPEPYRGDELARLGEVLAACREHGLDLVYCLSPGLTVRYAGDDDLERLRAKFESVAALGVRRFGLLLDDIPAVLQHAADRDAFGDLVDAQCSLIGRLFDSLVAGDASRRLVVCPTRYWGYGDEDEITRLGRGTPVDVDLFWTGRTICAHTIDRDDATRFAAATGRPPLYWDNYPVNDVAMTHELHLGPYLGRDPELAGAARGIVVNPMEFAEASKIPLATIGDFLVDPHGYDPESSWRSAIAEVAGADAADFELFADNVRSSCLNLLDAPTVTEAIERWSFADAMGRGADGARDLAALADRLVEAADRLLAQPPVNRRLIAQTRPWIESFRIGGEALQALTRLAIEGRLERSGPPALRPLLEELRARRRRVFGDVLDMTLADLVMPIASGRSHPTRTENKEAAS